MKQSHAKVGSSNHQIFAGYAMWFKTILTRADIKNANAMCIGVGPSSPFNKKTVVWPPIVPLLKASALLLMELSCVTRIVLSKDR